MRVARVSARKAVAPYVSGKPGVCPRIATFDLIAFVNELSTAEWESCVCSTIHPSFDQRNLMP
jgi:hypothetical protein